MFRFHRAQAWMGIIDSLLCLPPPCSAAEEVGVEGGKATYVPRAPAKCLSFCHHFPATSDNVRQLVRYKMLKDHRLEISKKYFQFLC